MNIDALQEYLDATSYNTAYTLRAYALALRDITPFGRNVVYAGDDKQNFSANAPKLRLSCGYAVLFGHPNVFGTSHIRCAII